MSTINLCFSPPKLSFIKLNVDKKERRSSAGVMQSRNEDNDQPMRRLNREQ